MLIKKLNFLHINKIIAAESARKETNVQQTFYNNNSIKIYIVKFIQKYK